MRRILPVALLGWLLIVGCATHVAPAPPVRDHPANPQSPEAPYAGPASTLRQEPQDAARTSSPQSGMQGMEGMKHSGSGKETSHAPSEHGHFTHHGGQQGAAPQPGAKESGGAVSGGASPETKDLYTCPMHPEVIQNKPGNCPKCGMKLVKKAGERK